MMMTNTACFSGTGMHYMRDHKLYEQGATLPFYLQVVMTVFSRDVS